MNPPPPPALPEPPFHSRQSSSDSSGYHEATSSYLHEEHCTVTDEKASSDSSGVSSLDAKDTVQSSQANILNAKKRKAPPPPPIVDDDHKEEELEKPCKNHKEADVENARKNHKEVKENKSLGDHKELVAKKSTDNHKEQAGKNFLDNHKELEVKKSLDNNHKTLVAKKSLDHHKEPVTKSSLSKHMEPETKKPADDGKKMSSDNPKETDVKPLKDHKKLEMKKSLDINYKDAGVMSMDNHKEANMKKGPVKAEIVVQPRLISHKPLAQSALKEDVPEVKVTVATYTTILPVVQNEIRVPETCKELVQDNVKKTSNKNDTVTKVALVALNARIEQDVTQQEIASSIQAAFHSLDNPPSNRPSLLAIKQRKNDNAASTPVASGLPSPSQSPCPATKEASYPLQKSCARSDIHLEDDLLQQVDGFETFPPPPSEFCGSEKEESPAARVTPPASSRTLRRSSSLLNLTDSAPSCSSSAKSKRIRHLQRSLSDLSCEDKGEFEAEQERLQREYIKLQRQFILWQQQLLNNHAMLREECIVPQYARTLRQSHSLPEGEDYSDEPPGPCVPLVSRSLSYEPTKDRSSTLPRSTINIPSLEFGSVPITNGSSTLRSSKAKSYFKPPQIRISTKNRQRLPPEIRKDGEQDIFDDAKILTTILPTFDNLKLISEKNEDLDSSNPASRKPRNNAVVSQNLENLRNHQRHDDCKKVPPPVPNKTTTFARSAAAASTLSNNGSHVNGHGDNHLRSRSNGDAGRLCDSSSKVAGQPLNIIPPPPALPVAERSKLSTTNGSNKLHGPQSNGGRRVVTPQVDPREQLMNEIRKFGGRIALRKISLDMAS